MEKKLFEKSCRNIWQNEIIVLPLHSLRRNQASLTVGAIAQMVEQRTENPCVPGSIPGGTTRKRVTHLSDSFFCFIPYFITEFQKNKSSQG